MGIQFILIVLRFSRWTHVILSMQFCLPYRQFVLTANRKHTRTEANRTSKQDPVRENGMLLLLASLFCF